ncbi:PH domain-containing protein [Carboxylicivirga mesophila]|uniref:PH domain-containing protein n=1 Tax=Carboxylicivirga mesophila TaxID=1166478 RepID=A0ABS5KC45_9BACT|nr:PH domain-containing protein [Carboxylicivirga mesophila]MBS2212600.1 PH domain-containing protein [Carboxylicivirga mesophila]
MGLLNGILGHAGEVSIEKLKEEFHPILVEGEMLEKAYKVLRDMWVFTNKRLILVDKQGVTGKKVDYQSIPYRSIVRFSKESTGLFDLDAELKIWLSGSSEPIVKEFSKKTNVNEVYLLMSKYILE